MAQRRQLFGGDPFGALTSFYGDATSYIGGIINPMPMSTPVTAALPTTSRVRTSITPIVPTSTTAVSTTLLSSTSTTLSSSLSSSSSSSSISSSSILSSSSSSSSAASTTSAAALAASSAPSGSSLGTGALIGIIAGSVGGAILLLFLAVLIGGFLRRRRQQRYDGDDPFETASPWPSDVASAGYGTAGAESRRRPVSYSQLASPPLEHRDDGFAQPTTMGNAQSMYEVSHPPAASYDHAPAREMSEAEWRAWNAQSDGPSSCVR